MRLLKDVDLIVEKVTYVSQYFEDHKDPFDDDLWPPPKIELKHDLTQITQPLSKIINLFLSKKHFG